MILDVLLTPIIYRIRNGWKTKQYCSLRIFSPNYWTDDPNDIDLTYINFDKERGDNKTYYLSVSESKDEIEVNIYFISKSEYYELEKQLLKRLGQPFEEQDIYRWSSSLFSEERSPPSEGV